MSSQSKNPNKQIHVKTRQGVYNNFNLFLSLINKAQLIAKVKQSKVFLCTMFIQSILDLG